MKIHVRRRHIVNGMRYSKRDCPIALAFKEATGKNVSVGGMSLTANDARQILPLTAQRFIANFDAGKPVKPFAFVLK